MSNRRLRSWTIM